MNRRIGLTVGLLLAFAIFCVGLFAWRLTAPAQISALELQELGIYVHEPARGLADFSLPATSGRNVTNADLAGHWTLVFFGFTHCVDVCPTTLSNIAKAMRTLPLAQSEGVRVWMVSVDPARDEMEKLQGYVQHFDQRFVGVTGPIPELARFSAMFSANFVRIPGQEENVQFDHSSHLSVINPDGKFTALIRAPLTAKSIEQGLGVFLNHYPFRVAGDS